MNPSPNIDSTADLAVIGAGIIGLAAARAFLLREPDARVCVVEKEPDVALHQTGRNSGVVHAGIYYAPGSLKARFCTAGRLALKQYTAEHGIAYAECGKVIVASDDDEAPALQELLRRAQANGVPDVRLLDRAELASVEPAVRGVAALHSPHTGITDYVAVARSFASDIESAGGFVLTGFALRELRQDADGVTLDSADGRRLRAGRVLVCAGLYGDQIAMMAGDQAQPRIVPFRGDYFTLAPEKAGQVRGLVYPVADPNLPFLGVHLTRTVHGDVLVGPNAILATAREGYRLSTFKPREFRETLAQRGFWRFARRYWRVGIDEAMRATSRRRFAADAARYLPGIERRDLLRTRAGVRAQALDADGRLVDDFVVTTVGRVVNVRNAPSPGATSSMQIGEELATRLLGEPQPSVAEG